MGDCHLPPSYNSRLDTTNHHDKFPKMPTNTTCRRCERNPLLDRRRTKSESMQYCKEVKFTQPPTPPPPPPPPLPILGKRYPKKSHEYENMDLEYQYKDYWYDPTTIKNEQRIRSNLCELPTSYITNIENNVKCLTYEQQSVKFFDRRHHYHHHYHHCMNTNENNVIIMKQDDFNGSLYNNNHRRKINNNNNNNSKTPNIDNQTKNQLEQHEYDISYDTSTYFDKMLYTANFREKYAKEIQAMRERLDLLRDNRTTVETTTPPKISEISSKYVQTIHDYSKRCDKATTCDISTTTTDNNNDKIISRNDKNIINRKIKLKAHRKGSGTSVNSFKIKTKLKITSSTRINDGNGNGDGDYDNNADDDSDDNNGNKSEDNSKQSEISPQYGNGDYTGWPVRLSLFPNVPPYIKFASYDTQTPYVLRKSRRYFKWELSTITPILVRKTLTNTGFVMVRKSNQWIGTWGRHMKSPLFKSLKDYQKLNHFPGTFQLGRKDRLWRNFQKLILKFGYKEFGFIPQCFILPHELKLLKQCWEYKVNGIPSSSWIIKPPASARGTGIRVINRWAQLPRKTPLVVQKYISNPYLINGSKFDLRLYVLVTSFNPLRIYLYPDGLARFASAKYSDDVNDLKERYIHLTNYSINKLSSQYTANEDANSCQGHKWTITKLFEYMHQEYGVNIKNLWKNLQQLVIKTFITAESPIVSLCTENMMNRYNCYELFGVDVLLDDQLKPWLLEVNISPSLHTSSPLDAHVKGPLVQTLFDLAQFHFPPRLQLQQQQQKKPSVIPQTYDPRLYTTHLTQKEKDRHYHYLQFVNRPDYLHDILDDLSGDDIRKLIQIEDEYVVKGQFERIFPTNLTYKYLKFMEPRYYNRLCDAWETKYWDNRQDGIELLKNLCIKQAHLNCQQQTTFGKNSPNTIHADSTTTIQQKGSTTKDNRVMLQPSKYGQSHPLVEEMQEISLENNSN